MESKQAGRVLVVLLDGVSYSILDEYIEKGYLHHLRDILVHGFRLCQMDASIPEVSNVTWSSFITGVNPGEHGIFGYVDLLPGSYKVFFPGLGDIQAPTLFDILAKRVKDRTSTLYKRFIGRVKRPIRTIVSPETENLLRPTASDRKDCDAFFKDMVMSIERKSLAFERILNDESWDLFVCVINETDSFHHLFFDAVKDPCNPAHTTFISLYRKIDEVVGRLFTRFMEVTEGKGFFMTISDHGFTGIKKDVYLNTWLRKNGFLRIASDGNHLEGINLEGINTGTVAFCIDPARIYINMKERYPLGMVSERDRRPLIDELKSALHSIVDDCGRPVIRAVYEKDELYSGPLREKGPDLVCIPHDGFNLRGGLQNHTVFANGETSGMHTSYDAHCVLPDWVQIPERLHIEDLAGFILGNFID